MNTTLDSLDHTDIAIIGLAGRFPGAPTVDAFWQNLRDGVESISFFTESELRAAGVDANLLKQPNYVKANSVLTEIDLFDAFFFDFSATEAERTDPQHRLFLEQAWNAIESAGYNTTTYAGAIGVYAGSSINTYLLNNLYHACELSESASGYQLITGNDKDFLPTRVSYKLNLKGPSITVQTACSTSLVAVHLACQGLLNGECDLALAGGVSVRVPQVAGYLHQEGMIFSPDGHCRAFDARAQGTVGGSGVGVVVLKRLSDALADRDMIHAVIKGSAINNDGALKIGYTAPSIEGQAAVIAEAHAIAQIDPTTITYVEAHGTGTPLGDPIELAALTQAFATDDHQTQFCAIGSLKTNIGHLDAAAGVAGLIKTILALKHRQIPPSLHFQQPNPEIDFAHSPFYVNTRLLDWQTSGTPRRAGVSSFGIGGTNAHLVLEEAPSQAASGVSRPYQLLLLSAKTRTALETATANLAAHLRDRPDLPLADVAYTLSRGRQTFNHRRLLVCADTATAERVLHSRDPQQLLTDIHEPGDRPIAFLFSGQGSQYAGMTQDLYHGEPLFRQQIDECATQLLPQLGLDLRQVLYPDASQTETATNWLQQTAIAQPALFVIEYALAQLWIAWGVRPAALIGHSIGEYVAATIAGVFSLEDALALVAMRGRLMQSLPAGKMLAVALPLAQIQPLLGPLSLAAVNGPANSVVSGEAAAIEALEQQLIADGISCRCLHTSHAFHSAMMDPILDRFTDAVRSLNRRPPQIPYLSNVTGTWIRATEATDPDYWATHLRQTVRFADGLQTLFQEPARILLEVGPGRSLTQLAQQHPDKPAETLALSSIRHPQTQQSDVAVLLTALGRLWLAGTEVNWSAVYAHEQRQRLPLPTYPFERQRYWVDPPSQATAPPTTPLNKQADIASWFYVPSWKRSYTSRPVALAAPILIFADEAGLGDGLAQRLTSEQQAVTRVKIGSTFELLGDRTYCLNPQNPSDYRALIEKLSQNGLPKHIVHLWSVTPELPSPGEAIDQTQHRGFYSLLFLAQALGSQPETDEIQITVISNHMQSVIGGDLRCPTKATLLGAIKVIPQEYAHLRCRSIDLDAVTENIEQREAMIETLAAEVTRTADEPIVAYRQLNRWIPLVESVALPAASGFPKLRPQGVYLITGGLGGIGMTIATHLAQTVHAKLILIGRSPLPPRSQWNDWLATHPDTDPLSRKIRKLQELEAFGSEVIVIAADVASQAQMQAAIAQADQQFGSINGIIHAAGIPAGGIIQQKTKADAAAIFSAKVTGTLVLDQLFQDQPLDFWVLCSSLTAQLGGFGQADYTGANAFLDAFAHYKRATGTFTLSINWEGWKEVGMAVPSIATASPGREQTSSWFDRHFTDPSGLEVYGVRLSHQHWLVNEHRLNGKATLPGTAYLEFARAACDAQTQQPFELRDVTFLTPLTVAANTEIEVRVHLHPQSYGFQFQILSQSSPDLWIEHACGEIHWLTAQSHPDLLSEIISTCNQREIQITKQTDLPRSPVAEFGARWNSIKWIKFGDNCALSRLELANEFVNDLETYKLHPALLDAATGLLAHQFQGNDTYLPFSYKRLRSHNALPATLYSYVRLSQPDRATAEHLSFDVTIFDEQGRAIVEIEDYTLRKTATASPPAVSTNATTNATTAANYYLTIADPGALNSLRFQPCPRQLPQPGEVEIAVAAVGLNFKEVLLALGLLPLAAEFTFGLECAGTIVAVGEGVEDLAIGDEVMALASSCFRPFVTTSAKWVARKPSHLSLAEAATIPVAFATAYHALITLGQLSQGERILIHAAAGGVGMAAVQIAQWRGAHIFATAGSEEKRAFLRSLGLAAVMDSRSLAFADQIMQQTQGEGVDLVLNALSGEFLPKSLAVLGRYGRFLEIGQRDILSDRSLGLRPFEKSLSFIAANLDPERPRFRAMWQELIQHIHDRQFGPLPHRLFPSSKLAEAFEYMAAAKHIGKIVVPLDGQAALEPFVQVNLPAQHPPLAVPPRRSTAETLQTNALQFGLTPAEGIEVFQRILGSRLPQVLVSTCDLCERLEQSRTHAAAVLAEPAQPAPPSYPRPALTTDYVPPKTEIEQTIAAVWQDVLGLKQIGRHDNFFELGGDSLLIVQVRSKLQSRLTLSFSIADAFEYPTISALADYLSGQQAEVGLQAVNDRAKQKELARQERQQLIKQRKRTNG